jgi:hypothetical protein
MTNQELIEKAGREWTISSNKGGDMNTYLGILIQLVREDERKVCIDVIERMMGDWKLGREVATALRGGKK